MLSFLLSHGRDLETHQLKKLCCRVPRRERDTSLHFDRDIGQETSAQDRRHLRNGGTNEANSAPNAKGHRAPSRGNVRRENRLLTTRSRIAFWLATKKPEIASTSLAFYQNSLGKFLEFLGHKGRRTDERRDKSRHHCLPESALNRSFRENRAS
jgi:hypothetical protein